MTHILIIIIALYSSVEVIIRLIIKFKFKDSKIRKRIQRDLNHSNVVGKKFASFEPHPYIHYIKKKNMDGIYLTNNYGYVGKKNLSVEKKNDTVRIYCAGGSTTELGEFIDGKESHWPALLERYLLSNLKGNYEVINAGVSGYTSAESLADFIFRGVNFKPDVLLIYHNINDAWSVQMSKDYQSDYSHARVVKSWKYNFLYNLPIIKWLYLYQIVRSFLIQKFSKGNGLIKYISNPPWVVDKIFHKERSLDFKRNIKNIVTIAQSNGIKPVIIKWERDWSKLWNPAYLVGGDDNQIADLHLKYLKENNSNLHEVSIETGCHYIDMGPLESDYFHADGIHLNFKGRVELSELIGSSLIGDLAEILVNENKQI